MHKTTIRFDPDFWEMIQIAIAKRRFKTFQDACDDALRKWLEKEPIVVEKPVAVAGYPPKHQAAHDLLEEILTKGTKDDVDYITGNLKVFAEAIRGRPARARRATGK